MELNETVDLLKIGSVSRFLEDRKEMQQPAFELTSCMESQFSCQEWDHLFLTKVSLE